MEALYQKYREQGFMMVTLISDAEHPNPPEQAVTVEDVNLWVEEYGINHPVLVDSEWLVGRDLWSESYFFDEMRGYAAPQTMIMKPGMKIIADKMWDYDEDIIAIEEVFMEQILP